MPNAVLGSTKKLIGITLSIAALMSIAPAAPNLIQPEAAQAASKTSVNIPSNRGPWESFGKDISLKPGSTLIYNWNGVNVAGPYYIQESANGSSGWKNVKTITTRKEGNGYAMSYNVPDSSKSRTTYYRLYHPSTTTVNEWSSRAQKVTYTSAQSKFSSTFLDRPSSIWPTNSAQKMKQLNLSNGGNRTVYMQKLVNGKWTNVKLMKTGKGHYGHSSFTYGESKQQTGSYRFYAPASGRATSATSPVFKTRYEDPTRYTGLLKTEYNYMKSYCSRVTLTTDKKINPPAMAYMYQKRIVFKPTVANWDNTGKKFIALHECAHVRQGMAYSDHGKLDKDSNKLFRVKSKGIEYLADCMAHRMGASKKFRSYGHSCSSAQYKAADRVLAGRKI